MRICRRGDALVVDAPAKLNLALEVLGRRADGFHDLETVMVALSLRDTLAFRLAPVGVFRLQQCSALNGEQYAGTAPPSGADNLVLKAARLLAETTNCPYGVEIRLVKRIPWQAGLGGGSSDAAATLVALNQLWDLRMTPEALHGLAARLGSDLNFFIARVPLALCRGRGEVVTPAPLRRRLDLVVAQPPGGLATSAVFARWTPRSLPMSFGRLLNWLSEPGAGPPPAPYNALQPAARELHPGIERVCRQLVAAGAAMVAMTGSGSACFGVCRSRRHARRVARTVRLRLGCATWAESSVV